LFVSLEVVQNLSHVERLDCHVGEGTHELEVVRHMHGGNELIVRIATGTVVSSAMHHTLIDLSSLALLLLEVFQNRYFAGVSGFHLSLHK
jgi:hypothetical protein